MIKEGTITYSDLRWKRKIDRDVLKKVKEAPVVISARYKAVIKGKELRLSFSGDNYREKLIRFCEAKNIDFSIFTKVL